MRYDVPNIPLRYAQDMPQFFFNLGQDPHIFFQKVLGLYKTGVSCRSVMMLIKFLLIT